MNVKLDTIILYVQDVELLKNFYVEHFNLTVIEEDSTWALLEAGAAKIGLHKIGDQYLKKINTNHIFDNNTKIVFEIDLDIEAARYELVSKNIEMREIKTFENYDFWLCDGTDPEGNVFQLKSKK
ncbi:lactoylglutathione lyase [Chryseobacterium phosphatilyticum]|uniref:Lactoylglutathione lyase n=1 Tax=Chryseobacterium phosphatilyticum TaxID=475075 RepID=A0A316X873_9FLAO|nr:lactoylglutathione lyase [Chryseobacterium phosphatilyticum]PWN70031.1 lactoylglutathione lyase [Chryseobacterium phosphatilyticum]